MEIELPSQNPKDNVEQQSPDELAAAFPPRDLTDIEVQDAWTQYPDVRFADFCASDNEQ